MPEFRPFTADDAVAGAEAALAASLGCQLRIGGVTSLGGDERRNLILRGSAMLLSGEILPIIIKATRAGGYDAAAANAYTVSGLVKEWAATTLLGRPPRAGHCARLLAANLALGVLVFDDAGTDRPSLVNPLLHGSAAEAEAALTCYAVALGRLHAATAGCQTEHHSLVCASLPAAALPPRAQRWVEREVQPVLALLGGAVPPDELALIAGRLQSPGPWLGLVHGDPCPDNVLLVDDGVLLIDFEFAAPGHVLLDAAYWQIGFPTCWCAGVVPRPIRDRIDRAYRATVASAVPEDDAGFRLESAIISAAWLFGSLSWLLEVALREERKWGISTGRNRILHYLEFTISTLDEASILPGLCATASTWLSQLRALWPDASPLAVYPAFSSQDVT